MFFISVFENLLKSSELDRADVMQFFIFIGFTYSGNSTMVS